MIVHLCIYYSYAIIVDCWYTDQHNRPKFNELVQQLSTLLEQEAGYLDLGQSLSWREHSQPQDIASRASVPTIQKVEEEVKSEEQEGSDWDREETGPHIKLHQNTITGRETKV